MSIHTELTEPLRPDTRAVLCCSGTIKQTSTGFTGLLEACFQVRKSCHSDFDAVLRMVFLLQNPAITGRRKMRLKDVSQIIWLKGQSHSLCTELREAWMVWVATIVFKVTDLDRPMRCCHYIIITMTTTIIENKEIIITTQSELTSHGTQYCAKILCLNILALPVLKFPSLCISDPTFGFSWGMFAERG